MRSERARAMSRGVPTRAMLVATMVLIIASVTFSSLLALRKSLQHQVQRDFSEDLTRSVDLFRSSDALRLSALRRDNALLADLPSLRALMTTGDAKTIADGAVRFWTVSGSDLFALADSNGQLVTAYTRGAAPGSELRSNLQTVFRVGDKRFLLGDGRLFEYSVQPLLFGTEETGTVLGYVVTGYAVETSLMRQTSQSLGAEIAFVSGRRVVTSTLAPALWGELVSRFDSLFEQAHSLALHAVTVPLDRDRYLMSSMDLSEASSAPLQLLVLKSFAHPDRARRDLNWLLLLVGASALCAGTLLMLAVSGVITGPLELLTRSVHEYGRQGEVRALPPEGTREVRELSRAFAAMSSQIREKNQALLESERLAVIGRMASSVSHDLRHYLAAVYANAEFLVSSKLTEAERADLFEEIRLAVHGTTDLIESLLIFSRSNGTAPRTLESLAQILDRAVTLVRTHPDAQGTQVHALASEARDVSVAVDARQVERAIYNLLLNACQAVRGSAGEHRVTAQIEVAEPMVKLRIADNGAGVSDTIRDSLFEPFVSEGKQNGTGLGLTMANVIAREHGGSVHLLCSRPGQTVFVLSLARATIAGEPAGSEGVLESSR